MIVNCYYFNYLHRIERKRREKEEQETYKLELKQADWDPLSNPEGTQDPFRTLFVSRINFYTSESKLKREFETYGPIKNIKMIPWSEGQGNDSIAIQSLGLSMEMTWLALNFKSSFSAEKKRKENKYNQKCK